MRCLLFALLLLECLFFSSSSGYDGRCNLEDRAIYYSRGSEFQEILRSLVGWVPPSKETYSKRIQVHVGLSAPCAMCYGEMYACGYAHCKWACKWHGTACDVCLEEHDCSPRLRACTGLPTEY